MSDRIAVMNEGRLLGLGAPARSTSGRGRACADFSSQTNFLEVDVSGWDGTAVEVELPGSGRLRTRMPDGIQRQGRMTLAVRPEKISLL